MGQPGHLTSTEKISRDRQGRKIESIVSDTMRLLFSTSTKKVLVWRERGILQTRYSPWFSVSLSVTY